MFDPGVVLSQSRISEVCEVSHQENNYNEDMTLLCPAGLVTSPAVEAIRTEVRPRKRMMLRPVAESHFCSVEDRIG